MRPAAVSALSIIVAAAAPNIIAPNANAQPTANTGFTLLDFRSASQIQTGNYRRWVPDSCGQGPDWVEGQPLLLSYAVDPDFLSSQPPGIQQQAPDAVLRALQTWSEQTRGFIQFSPSPWQTVENRDDAPIICFEGPGIDEWQMMGQPVDTPPGWGANIEFFSRPTGFTITSNGINYQMGAGNLGFAVVHRQGDTIRAVDIYLNDDFNWRVHGSGDDSAAAQQPAQPPQHFTYGCACAARHHARVPANADTPRTAARSTFDIETVVLHELGHALGLDHPNEADANTGALVDPFSLDILPAGSWRADAVMHGAYTGVKHDLRPEDIGGAAFLYPPDLRGDLNSNLTIDLTDSVRALDVLEAEQPSPWDVQTLDFLTPNGTVEAAEVAQILHAVFSNDDDQAKSGACPNPATITINLELHPADLGLGGPARLTISLQNPQQLPIRAWDLFLSYDPTILSQPTRTTGDLLPGGVWVPLGDDDGTIRFAKLALGEDEDAPSGVLGTIHFNVDIDAAVAAGASTIEALAPQLTVACPEVHVFGDTPGESLIVNDASAVAWNYDADNNGVVNTEDWYAFTASPIDVNQDGIINSADHQNFRAGLRSAELEAVLQPR